MERQHLLSALASAMLLVTVGVEGREITDTLGFDKASATYATELLDGRMSGVVLTPSSSNILDPKDLAIRGLNSIRGLNDPLIIVDGAVVTGDMSHLNAYDVVSIEVIKDVTALALYGSRGANGVVIINTRNNSKEKLTSLVWHSNAGYNGGLNHNHHAKLSGTSRTFSYDLSAWYRRAGADERSGVGNLGGMKFGFSTTAGKYIWAGADLVLGLGKMDNSKAYDDILKTRGGNASAWLQVNFLPGFVWKTTFSGNYNKGSESMWYGLETQTGRLLNGYAMIRDERRTDGNILSQLRYSTFLAKVHKLEATAGVEYILERSSSNTLEGSDFFDHSLRADGLNIMNSEKKTRKYDYRYNHLGLMASLSYTYRNIAGVDLSFRADNTRRYADGKFDLYPAVSAFACAGPVKFVAGWGMTGSERLLPYFDVAPDAQPYFEALSKVSSGEWHVGAETSLFDGRLRLGLKYYDRMSTDSYLVYRFGERGKNFWYKTDMSTYITRNTTIANRGFEFDADAVVISSGDWNWTVNLNGAWNTNQILRRDAADSWVIPGYGAGVIIGYDVDREGYYVDTNNDGRITEADCRILGDAMPKLSYGIGTTLKWRSLSFDVLMNGIAFGDGINASLMASEGVDRITPRYIGRADGFNIRRISLGYDIALKTKVLKCIGVSASGLNLFQTSRLEGAPLYTPCGLLGVSLQF